MFKRPLGALALCLVLSVVALGGDMFNPGIQPPPPDDSSQPAAPQSQATTAVPVVIVAYGAVFVVVMTL